MDPPTEEEIKAEKAETLRKKPDPQDATSDAPEMPKTAPPPPPPPDEASGTKLEAETKPKPTLTSEESTSTAAAKGNETGEKQDPETKKPVKDTSSRGNAKADVALSSIAGNGPVAHEERSKAFHELRSYEAKRRTIYTSKMRSTSIYWRAFRDLLTRSYQETDRAENLIRGAVVANKSYANYLRAAAEDRIDGEGNPVNDTRGARIKLDRKKKYNSLGGGSLLMAYGMQNKTMEKILDTSTSSNDGGGPNEIKKNTSFEHLPSNSVLNDLVQMQSDMAEKFTENISFVEDVTLAKMVELRRELEAELTVMSVLGDATLYELEKAEGDVQKAWSSYYSLACLADSSALEKASTVTDIDPTTIRDVWLVEMHYRMSVAYLTTVWEKSSSELSALFAGVKEMECNRRFRLRELLVLFTQRGERLWDSLPPLVKPVLAAMQETPTEIKVIETKVTETIREKAKEFQQQDERSISTDPLNGPGLAGVPEIRDDFELQSPLMSNLLNKVEVIWRKSDKIMAVWKPCLAATTADGYLHLFDIPTSANVVSGVKAETAFQTLVPPVVVPTEDAIVEGYSPPNMGRSWFENLIPGTSFNLRNSSISFSQDKGNSTFEITETLAPTKLSKFSNHTRNRKYALRLYSSQRMVDWLLSLRELGAK